MTVDRAELDRLAHWCGAFIAAAATSGALGANDDAASLIDLVAVLWSRDWQHAQHGVHSPRYEHAEEQMIAAGQHVDTLAEVSAKLQAVRDAPTPAPIADAMAEHGWTPIERGRLH